MVKFLHWIFTQKYVNKIRCSLEKTWDYKFDSFRCLVWPENDPDLTLHGHLNVSKINSSITFALCGGKGAVKKLPPYRFSTFQVHFKRVNCSRICTPHDSLFWQKSTSWYENVHVPFYEDVVWSNHKQKCQKGMVKGQNRPF